jgi:hypothetical protein
MATYQILTSETGSANSLPFRINLIEKAYLGISGTIGNAVITLEWKAPDGNYYPAGDIFSTIGLHPLPNSTEIVLRLAIIGGGGSSINAVVFNGVSE